MNDLHNFRLQWENTRRTCRGYTRVNVNPLECYIGYDDELCLSLMIVSSCKINNAVSSKSVKISQGKKDKLRFQLEISLSDENLEEVFIRMCYDLLRYSENAEDDKIALKNFYRRYRQWQNLFENGKSGLLTVQEQHGLMGELLFLRSQIIEMRRSLNELVEGWYGPFNEHQDFSYSDKWYEIKTVMEQAEKVQISSLEQLSRLDAGELVIYRFSKTSGVSDNFDLNKFTLNGLVKNLFLLLAEDFLVTQKFESLLLQAGYIEREEYDEQSYKLMETMSFEVDDEFPRLVKDRLPCAILSATYSLDIRELKNLQGERHGF